MISTVFFDFGGVLAEDGFRTGLLTIAEQQGYDPGWFQRTAVEAIYQCGYVNGLCEEHVFWELLRKNTGHSMKDHSLRRLFVSGYKLWPRMIDYIKKIKTLGFTIILISDHTDWLDELDNENAFFHLFDKVYNSYHIHQSKRDGTLFGYVLSDLGVNPENVLLIDDNTGNIRRANSAGMNVYQFTDTDSFIKNVMPILDPEK
jgi:putative hydrolase of the HAD superfamily